MDKSKLQPMVYKITFLLEGYNRKNSFVVVAMDVQEAINVATVALGEHHRFCEAVCPRWAESYPVTTPDLLSPAALAYYGGASDDAMTKTVVDLKQRCLDVRDAVNRYHQTKLQSDLDELDRLMTRLNTPDLIR